MNASGKPAMKQAGQTISVIDDDESVRRALRRLIHSFGWNVETFASAEEFLAPAEHRVPACLILDLRMPGMSGLELHERLAADGRRIPVVFITGHPDESARRAALAAGAVEFLQKPFDDQLLLDAVSRALAQGNNKRAQP
jgi:FixJ family two-component response regulator